MNKKVEGKILDIAAELVVSPLALFVKACEIKETIAESETYEKTKEAARSAGNDIKNAAKRAYESDTVQKGIETVKDTAKKVSESEAYTKTKEAVTAGVEKAKEGINTVAEKFGRGGEKGAEEETCTEAEDFAEASEETCGSVEEGASEEEATKEETLEDMIAGVDLSEIITEDDANEDVPE